MGAGCSLWSLSSVGKVRSGSISQFPFPALQTHPETGFPVHRRALRASFPPKHKGMEPAVLMGRPGLGGCLSCWHTQAGRPGLRRREAPWVLEGDGLAMGGKGSGLAAVGLFSRKALVIGESGDGAPGPRAAPGCSCPGTGPHMQQRCPLRWEAPCPRPLPGVSPGSAAAPRWGDWQIRAGRKLLGCAGPIPRVSQEGSHPSLLTPRTLHMCPGPPGSPGRAGLKPTRGGRVLALPCPPLTEHLAFGSPGSPVSLGGLGPLATLPLAGQ